MNAVRDNKGPNDNLRTDGNEFLARTQQTGGQTARADLYGRTHSALRQCGVASDVFWALRFPPTLCSVVRMWPRVASPVSRLRAAGPCCAQVKDCEIWFMAFDILYRQDSSVMDDPLRSRKVDLEAAVRTDNNGTVLLGPAGQRSAIRGRIFAVAPTREGPELPGPPGGKNIKRAHGPGCLHFPRSQTQPCCSVPYAYPPSPTPIPPLAHACAVVPMLRSRTQPVVRGC